MTRLEAEGHTVTVTTRSATKAAKGNVLLAAVALSLGLSACAGPSAPPAADARQVATDTAPESTLAKGARLYAGSCQWCHGDRQGKGATQGAPRHNEEGHTWHHPDAQLHEWVLKGRPGFGGSPGMPAFGDKLSEDNVTAILAHIKTWWTEEQRTFQADVSKRYQQALEDQQQRR